MERYSINADQAFRLLVRSSHNGHHKLRAVTVDLVTTRKLRDHQPQN